MKIENGVLSNVITEDIINGNFEIPNSVTFIGEYAFSHCHKFKKQTNYSKEEV